MGTGAVVLCTWFGDVPTVPEEAQAALTLGRQTAEALGSGLEWLVLGSAPADCDAVAAELDVQVAGLSRSDLTVQSLESFGALILVRDAEEACRLTNLIAPEHLHIAVDDTEPLLDQIESAGAIFLGHHSPVALGDYVAGPSHVLPTGGTARWAAGLSANDFLRGGSIIEYSRAGLAEIADDVRLMADKEGLTAHRGSVDIRCS